MDTPLPAVFASHFTAKVAATCSIISIAVFLIPAGLGDESALFFTRFGICVLHAFLAFIMFTLEHRYAVEDDAPRAGSVVSIMLLYFVNVGAATLPIVALLYGPQVVLILRTG